MDLAQLDKDGWFVGFTKPDVCQITGDYIFPGGAIEALPNIREGYDYRWDGDKYIEVPTPEKIAEIEREEMPIEGRKLLAVEKVKKAASDYMAAILMEYPLEEQLTFDMQVAEAFEDEDTPTPLLSGIAAARGVGLSDLKAKVLQKRAAYLAVAGEVIGKRQKLVDTIQGLTDPVIVDNLEIDFSEKAPD